MTKVLRWAAAVRWTGFVVVTLVAPLVRFLGLNSFFFSLALNQLLMIWVLYFFTLAQPPLDHPWLEPYFRIRPWERDGKRWLSVGVLPFQTVLKKFRIGVFGGMRPKDFRVTGDPAFLTSMVFQTMAAESAHLLCFVIVVGFAAYAAAAGQWLGAVWLVTIGFVSQIYPVMLQRYHRPRWRRAQQRRLAYTTALTPWRRRVPAIGLSAPALRLTRQGCSRLPVRAVENRPSGTGLTVRCRLE